MIALRKYRSRRPWLWYNLQVDLFIRVIVIADINECNNPRNCLSGRCVNSYGGYYCLTDNSFGKPHSFAGFIWKIDFILGFPKPGSFCKTGFSVLGKAKTGFRFRFRFWKSHNCIHCKSAGVEDGADRTVCSAGNVQVATGEWRVATVACAANSLIDLMLGDLETFLNSLNDWSEISDAVKLRWWFMSDFICEVTEVTLNDIVDFDAWLMNIKLSHCQLIIAICRSVMPCIWYILTILGTVRGPCPLLDTWLKNYILGCLMLLLD